MGLTDTSPAVWRPLPRLLRLTAGLLFIVLICSHWLPALWRWMLFHGHGQALLMFVIAMGVSWQGLHAGPQRQTLWALSLALWAWVSVDLVVFLPPGGLLREALSEFGFFFYFLIITLELERMDRRLRGLSLLDTMAAPMFLVGLFIYMIGLPLLRDSSEYDTAFPQQLFYLCADIYLLTRCTSLLWYVDDRRWRDALALLQIALWSVLFVDIGDGLLGIGWLATVPTDPWQGMYYLPMLPLLAVAGFIDLSRWRSRPLACPRYGRWLLAAHPRLLFFGLLPFVIHLLGYHFALLHPQLRSGRELFLLIWLSLIFLLLRQQRRPVAGLLQSSPQPWAGAKAAEILLAPAAAEQPGETEPEIAGELSALMLKMNTLLLQRYTDPDLDLDTLADAMAISARQLQRRVKAETGLTPADYVRRFRLERAALLLKEGHKATFVAAAVGFHQQSHFGRLFKAQYGVTPGQYGQQSGESDKS